MAKHIVLAVAVVLLVSSVSGKFHFGSRSHAQAQAQAAAMASGLGGGYGSGYGMGGAYGGGMSSASAMAHAQTAGMGGMGMASGMASGTAVGGGMGGGMASGMASGMAMGGGMGMGMTTVTATASATIGTLQTRWNDAQGFCNDAMSRVANFIAKIEEIILGLPLTVIKAMMGIPIKVIQMALNVAQGIIPLLNRAKLLLGEFFQTVFELPAKALYGSISILADLTGKILDWGQTCHRQPVCPSPPPHIGGYGPCGGRWPCTRVVACQSSSCFSTARALESHEGDLDS